MTDKTESISDKLRHFADIKEPCSPLIAAFREFGIDETTSWDDVRGLFRGIADEIDAEKHEITERYARQSWMNPAEAIAKLATGEIEWPGLKRAIDRYYLPRPLFEDGEPVQFGDTFVRDYGKDGTVSSLTYTKGNSDYVNINGYERHDFDHRIKRPKHQVLDADGVPIEVGDTVYLVPGEHCGAYPLHGCEAGVEYTVGKNSNPEHVVNGRVCITRGDCLYGYPMPEQVTHREPDTQERIDRDAVKLYIEYWECCHVECRDCPAAIDGKNPCERYENASDCADAQRLDLLRRQRELDGRDA